MYVEISKEGELVSAHFGVSDYTVDGLSVKLAYFNFGELHDFDGIVTAAISPAALDKPLAKETISANLHEEIPVVVAASEHNHHIVEAAREMKKEYNGDLTLL